MVNLAPLKRAGWVVWWPPVYYELVYLVTALVASDTACLATSPGTSINTSANHQTELNIEVKNIHPCFFKCIHLPKLNIYSCILQVGVIVLYIHFQYKLYIHVLNSNVQV
jgi:hypothetical protein